jgi:hypothetical protein
MKKPTILKLIDTVIGPSWTIATGHGCNSELEMKVYCEEADPTGLNIKLVDLGEPLRDEETNSCWWKGLPQCGTAA